MPSAAATVPLTIATAARRAAEQDRLGQRPVQRDLEAFDRCALMTRAPRRRRRRSDRKKLDAANAIEMPKTIWISRRKPPEVSPKASDRPVTMMMITAMIFATGPWTESRIC